MTDEEHFWAWLCIFFTSALVGAVIGACLSG